MPRSSGTSLDNLLELYEETGNKGNMIHGEAPTRIFEYDREGSCYVSAKKLIVDLGWSPQRVAEELNKRFDLVVYSTANAIRENIDPGGTSEILDALNIDFVVLGMGMQKSLPLNTFSLHKNLVSLLEVCNKKAKVFGVRGFETEKWLKSVGYGNAMALGCPSLYVYPSNVLQLSFPEPSKINKIITGGYISARIPRAKTLIDVFNEKDVHYVMQDEIVALRERLVEKKFTESIYNDVTGEIKKEILDIILEEIHFRPLPFKSYRWFQDPNAWRMFASMADFYLGDRLHGGIVALQSGVPGILISEDQRVSEVAEFFDIPWLSVKKIKDMKIKDIIEEISTNFRLDKFKEVYHFRFEKFKETFENLDVQLTTSDSLSNALSFSSSMVSPGKKIKNKLKYMVDRFR